MAIFQDYIIINIDIKQVWLELKILKKRRGNKLL